MDAELDEQLLKLSLINKTALSSSSSPSNIRNTTQCVTAQSASKIEIRKHIPTTDVNHITTGHVAALINCLREASSITAQKYNDAPSCLAFHADDDIETATRERADGSSTSPRKTGPIVPPKPFKKKQNYAEIPKSSFVKQACEPLYSQRLQYLNNSGTEATTVTACRPPSMQKKQPFNPHTQNRLYNSGSNNSKVTLDNPAILEQQLEALAHHKKQLERKGLLLQQQQQDPHTTEQTTQKLTSAIAYISCIPKLSSTSLVENNACNNKIYTNIYAPKSTPNKCHAVNELTQKQHGNNVYSNVINNATNETAAATPKAQQTANIYSNIIYAKQYVDLTDLSSTPSYSTSTAAGYIKNSHSDNNEPDDDMLSPPSPVSSSYSELRRATDAFTKRSSTQHSETNQINEQYPIHFNENVSCVNNENEDSKNVDNQQTYMNMKYNSSNDYGSYNSMLQGSSTYESIYEPINPRPPSQLSQTASNYLMYVPSYINGAQLKENQTGINGSISNSSSTNLSTFSANMSTDDSSLYMCDSGGSNFQLNDGINYNHQQQHNRQKETEVEALTDFLVHSMDGVNDMDSYGICFKCNERVLGENSGCTAMEQIYHIACFTCSQCQINLQGKPFYALDGKPYCEYDYLQTLEKCSICMKPILERILRATGKPYHPQCFTCVVCGNSLDGIPFTVDATNQNYCIADFHKKFAPRCCVCKKPIMPELGEEETVRVVALDRSFHFECYKCEDCGLLLSSEAEGRGCYPLDDHVLCKSCNAKRVQMLTNRMTTEL